MVPLYKRTHEARDYLLVVDDEPNILAALEDLLEDDFDVVTESDPSRGLQLIKNEDFSVILADQRMPRLKGHEFLARAAELSPASTRVLITGYSDINDLVEAVNQATIYAYISKPWSPQQLRQLVRQAAERCHLVRKLRQERNLLHYLLDNIPDRVAFTDRDGLLLYVNRAYARAAGLSDPAVAMGKQETDLLGKEIAPLRMRAVQSERPLLDQERREGQRWVSSSRIPVPGNPDGVGVISICRDITEQKRSRQQLARQAEYQESLARLSHRALAEPGYEQIFSDAAATVETTFKADLVAVFETHAKQPGPVLVAARGWPPELLGQVLDDGQVAQSLASGQPIVAQDFLARPELAQPPRFRQHRARSGVTVPILTQEGEACGAVQALMREPRAFDAVDLRFMEAVSGVLALSIRRARAEEALRQSEEALRQAQKLDAVGRLAGGIAHDFNNILAAVKGFGELVLADLPADHPSREDVNEIHRAAERGQALTRQLLAFSRRDATEPKVVDLNAALLDSHKMLGRLLSPAVRLRLELASDPQWVLIDPGHLDQVIVNLAVNAGHAMPEGGDLTIATEPTPAGHRLTVRDTGCGMPPEVITHIFEPFFTTRERGQGTGMGLATVYGIVTGADGSVEVESQPGAGTCFIITLPPTESAQAEPSTPSAAVTRGGAGQRILVLDDDQAVLTLAVKALSREGYAVSSASSPSEALERLEGQSFDLLLSDVLLPEMSGAAFAEKLKQSHPGLQVLLMSGHPEQHLHRDEEDFLAKPFTLVELLAAIHRVMRRPAR